MANAEFLKQRAEEFFENAKESALAKRYNLAVFSLEQSCQLYLKYYIFLKIADFSKTHNIRDLLANLGGVYQKEAEIEKFKEKYASEISDLEESYITSRYLPVEFSAEQFQKIRVFLEELIMYLKKL